MSTIHCSQSPFYITLTIWSLLYVRRASHNGGVLYGDGSLPPRNDHSGSFLYHFLTASPWRTFYIWAAYTQGKFAPCSLWSCEQHDLGLHALWCIPVLEGVFLKGCFWSEGYHPVSTGWMGCVEFPVPLHQHTPPYPPPTLLHPTHHPLLLPFTWVFLYLGSGNIPSYISDFFCFDFYMMTLVIHL